MTTLLLASRSAARQAMLRAAGVPFEVVASDLDEKGAKHELRAAGSDALELAVGLAARKALAVRAPADALVVGSDQTLELDDGAMLDKAASRDEALHQLRRMSGRTHRLHAAAAVSEGGAIVWQAAESVTLSVRPLSDVFLAHYLDAETETIRGGVGCYRIEGPGSQLFDRIEGSHFAILGLPLLPLLGFLRERNLLGS